MRAKFNILNLLGLLWCTLSNGQDFSAYEKRSFIQGDDTLLYRLLMPANYDPAHKYPLVIFLHGSGERGRDNEKQLIHGGGVFLDNEIRNRYPAFIVFPQCPEGNTWANYRSKFDSSGKRVFDFQLSASPTIMMQLLQKLVAQLKAGWPVDKKRVYIGGLSMGGMGTFELTRRDPSQFAAAFPICGATDPSTAGSVNKISWWIFHGAKDNVVPPIYSIQMADALKREKASVRFSLYPEADHNSWDSAFAEKDLMPWLFSQRK